MYGLKPVPFIPQKSFILKNLVILSERSESKDPRLLFAYPAKNSGCPIHFAFFAKWVRNHEPQLTFNPAYFINPQVSKS
jgi:hypothetical protein